MIESQEKARKYWESFKARILFSHFKRKETPNKVGSEIESASLDEVRSAIEKELEPVFKRATLFINEGMSEELALAKSIVEWYKYNNSLVQNIQFTNSKRGKLTEEEVDALISNSARALDFDMGWLANDIALQAEQGNANSRCQLAAMYCQGQHGVPLDYTEAAKWYKLAAEQGDANAKFRVELMLGGMYDEGRGVPQNYTEAAKWYKLAAELGDADAQFKLGEMYDEGRGVPLDYTEAAKWYKLAAEQGDADAQFKLG
ncbi:MAG: sel1 repeat family protein [Nitrosomonadales bacterium]|nr:sel1 repeat family protein [Nitrosomonadales bacterium]